MRICPYCGSAVSQRANFCQNCGGDLHKRVSPEIKDASVYMPVNPPEQVPVYEPESSSEHEPEQVPEYEPEKITEYEPQQPAMDEFRRIHEYRPEKSAEFIQENPIEYREEKTGRSRRDDTRIYEPVKSRDRSGDYGYDTEDFDREEEEHYSRENRKTVMVGVILAALICVLGVGLWFVVSYMLDQGSEIDVGSGLKDKTVQVTAAPEEETEEEAGEDAAEEDVSGDENTEEAAAEEETAVTASVTAGSPVLDGLIQEAGVSESSESSVLVDGGVYHTAELMLDGDETSSWQEASSGDGTGEWVQLTLDRQYGVKYISFKLGNWRNESLFYANNRPSQILLRLDNQEFTIDFSDGMEEYTVELSEECQTSVVWVQINSVYEGSDWNDCCIAEMAVYGS